ncbi:metal-sensitive transcriptional regulator [Demequina zhanjiangensis]|uniref:Metal-sensitive transcriptional regulator n=1 Tax=Demequina zhanjiangensis TaxID=3051659 RepID=A0ABT8FYL4_9MICO|nr:metal-sensitive transcriptional regulator [Demequina sp. SYSU T00b26]MDN4471983.1 metal-sensitive transcriptional regulator [Demequina sp. SYSU T00b26]
MSEVHLTEADLEPVVKRLRRAHGQLAGVLRMVEEGRECGDIVTQLAAVSKAIDRAGFTMIASGLEQCVREGESASEAKVRLEKMFMALS